MILLKKDRDFISLFDDGSGMYIRSGVMQGGRDTGEDPFMASFPELLDVGIMGHCNHGKAGLCLQAGVQCYQRGTDSSKPNMAFDDFRWIAEQCRGRTFQFAVGGCGDPDQHEMFAEILQVCRQNRIVPSFTTSGYGMNERIVSLCKRYCGAVAVSWYRSEHTLAAIQMLVEAGVKTNVHYVLTNRSVREAVERLCMNGFPPGVNAVVFLLHKPVGLGTRDMMVQPDDPDFKKLISLADSENLPCKIGFDSCTVPALIGRRAHIGCVDVDTCEGARWSAYVTPDLKMLPCSFDCESMRWAVDLKTCSLDEAWVSREFDDFRDRLRGSCPVCPERRYCMGGCPICPEVVPCETMQASRKAKRVFRR